MFQWENHEQFTTWNLIINQCRTEENRLQSSGSLFETETIYKTYQLLPELKTVDYLIKVSSESSQINEKMIIDKIQDIPQVVTSYSVDITKLKTKEHLIF